MSELHQENLNKLVVKKPVSNKILGQDIIYVCSVCGNTEKEYALASRNYKFCGKCSSMSVKSNLLPTVDWIHSDVQEPDTYSDEV